MHTAHAALSGGGCSTPVAPETARGGGPDKTPPTPRINHLYKKPPTNALTPAWLPELLDHHPLRR
jgi:hypothetical protein